MSIENIIIHYLNELFIEFHGCQILGITSFILEIHLSFPIYQMNITIDYWGYE